MRAELARVREICLALPEVTERLSHGHRGWIGVHLNRGLDWNEIAGAIEDAYCEIAPKSLVEQARGGR